jgi:hypothetical protein
MTLRDGQGEIEVGIGDLFELNTGAVSASTPQISATFSVVCPDFTVSAAKPPIWVRLISGAADIQGKRYEVRPDGNEELRYPVLLFTGELVARLIREHRLMTFDIPTVPQTPVEKPAKAPSTRTSKKRERQQEPSPQTLFD